MKTWMKSSALLLWALALALLAQAEKTAPPPGAAATAPTPQQLTSAQQTTLRENLAARVPALAHIDEIRSTPMPGLYELRVGNELLYTDAQGNYLIQGSLLDTRGKKNLTQARIDQLTAIAFQDLPLKDAFPVVYGKGTRKMAAFEDPNCPYCKRFEKELGKIDDVTVYTFIIPILGPDSVKKSKQIWCSKDKAKTWTNWMVDGIAPTGNGDCDTRALKANLEFAQKYLITGTPTLVFAGGERIPGAINASQVEQLLGKK